MKKIIIALVSLFSFVSAFSQSAGNDTTQYVYYRFTYGNALDRYWAKKVLLLPADTTYSKDGLAMKAGTVYVGNGVKWTSVGSGGSGSADSAIFATLYRVDTAKQAIRNTIAQKDSGSVRGTFVNLNRVGKSIIFDVDTAALHLYFVRATDLGSDTLFIKRKGSPGDTLLSINGDTINNPSIRDSLGFHHVINADGSWTFYVLLPVTQRSIQGDGSSGNPIQFVNDTTGTPPDGYSYGFKTGRRGFYPVSAGTPALANTHIFVGNVGNVATDVAMSGDVTIANTGATAIGSSKITTAMIVANAVDMATKMTGTMLAAQEPAHTGDVTNTAGSLALTIAANAVTNAKAAQMAANTIKGNNTGGTANAADLTGTQVTAMLNLFTTTLQGLVPAPGSVTGKFLGDDIAWHAAAGGVSQIKSKNVPVTILGTDTVKIDTTFFVNTGYRITLVGDYVKDTFLRASIGASYATTLPNATLSFPGSTILRASGGNNSFANFASFTNTSTNFQPEKYKVRFGVVPQSNAANDGIGFGFTSVIASPSSYYVKIDLGTANSASLKIFNSKNLAGTPITTASGITFNTGDSLVVETVRNLGGSFAYVLKNLKNGLVTMTGYIYDRSNIVTTNVLPNLATPELEFFQGTQDVFLFHIIDLTQKNGNAIFLGDSITEGYNSGSGTSSDYPSMVFSGNTNLYDIEAGQSETTTAALGRVNRIISANPKYVIINLGVNDKIQSVTDSNFKKQLDSIVSPLQRAGIIVILTSLVPQTAVNVTTFNTDIFNLSVQRGCKYVDITTPLATGTAMNTLYNSGDGIHPNTAGHALIAQTEINACPELFTYVQNQAHAYRLPAATSMPYQVGRDTSGNLYSVPSVPSIFAQSGTIVTSVSPTVSLKLGQDVNSSQTIPNSIDMGGQFGPSNTPGAAKFYFYKDGTPNNSVAIGVSTGSMDLYTNSAFNFYKNGNAYSTLYVNTNTVGMGTLVSAASATPLSINQGGTHSSTVMNQAGMKLALFDIGSTANKVGFGVSVGLVEHFTFPGGGFNFYASTADTIAKFSKLRIVINSTALTAGSSTDSAIVVSDSNGMSRLKKYPLAAIGGGPDSAIWKSSGTMTATQQVLGNAKALSFGTTGSHLSQFTVYADRISLRGMNNQQTDVYSADADHTWDPGSSVLELNDGTLTANRTITVPTGLVNGTFVWVINAGNNASFNYVFNSAVLDNATGSTFTTIDHRKAYLLYVGAGLGFTVIQKY